MAAPDTSPNEGGGPTGPASLERAISLASHEMYTLDLQLRRLRSSEPEDEVFLRRPMADFQFFIVTLRRLRRCAQIVVRHPELPDEPVRSAAVRFDELLPFVSKARNVGEHIDDYALDSPKRRHDVSRKQLQVGVWGGETWEWLGETVDLNASKAAATTLYETIRLTADAVRSTSHGSSAPS